MDRTVPMDRTVEVYLTVEEVAKRIDVSTDTIFRWKRNGDFPKAVKLSRGTTRWRLSDIEAWERTCMVGFAAHMFPPANAQPRI